MGYFIRTSTKNDELPERVVAVPNSDYEKRLQVDEDFEELSHDDFKATFEDDQWHRLPEAVQNDTLPPQSPLSADVSAVRPVAPQSAITESPAEEPAPTTVKKPKASTTDTSSSAGAGASATPRTSPS